MALWPPMAYLCRKLNMLPKNIRTLILDTPEPYSKDFWSITFLRKKKIKINKNKVPRCGFDELLCLWILKSSFKTLTQGKEYGEKFSLWLYTYNSIILKGKKEYDNPKTIRQTILSLCTFNAIKVIPKMFNYNN